MLFLKLCRSGEERLGSSSYQIAPQCSFKVAAIYLGRVKTF